MDLFLRQGALNYPFHFAHIRLLAQQINTQLDWSRFGLVSHKQKQEQKQTKVQVLSSVHDLVADSQQVVPNLVKSQTNLTRERSV